MNRWKKSALILFGILLITFASFGIVSAKYGFNNASSLILHGHFEQNQTSQSTNDETIKTFNNSSTGLNINNQISNESPNTYTNSQGITVESPDNNPIGATARCNDGTYSHSLNYQGTCSSHGGVVRTIPKCDQTMLDTYTHQKDTIRVKYQNMNDTAQKKWNSEIVQLQLEEKQALGQLISQQGSQGVALVFGSADITAQTQLKEKYEYQITSDEDKRDSEISLNNINMTLELQKVDSQIATYETTCQL